MTSDISCCEKSSTSPLISCSGICRRAFHCKCVGFSANLRDRVMEGGNGLFWYCEQCRNDSTARYVAKFLKYKELFNGFMNQLKNLESQVASASSEINSISEKIPDALMPPVPNIILSPATPSADTASVGSEFPPPPSTVNSVAQPAPGVPENVAGPSSSAATSSNPLGLAVVLPAPRKKAVFLSRFSPDTTEDQLLAHVKHKCSSSPHASNLFCRKLTSRFRPSSEALISSFKLFVPLELFDAICCDSFWPVGVLVKEFVPRTVKLPAATEDFSACPTTQPQPL